MPLQCPHCQSTLVYEGAPPRDVVCPSCRSTIQFDPGATIAWLPDDAPKRLGKFAFIELLGVGSFGAVYKARDTELDRTVAIKVPRAGNVPRPEDMERFLREAKSAAQLKHPSIVALYDAGQSDGTCFLVSEFIQGTTLAERLSEQRLSFRQTAELIAEVAEALHYAHQHGVVHRDLKPSNIMLDLEGRPHLMDFGLAKRTAEEITMTLDGQVIGTPAYMSPEQARGEVRKVDARSDIYSLGVILYELLTGERPFRGQLRMLQVQVIQDEPRPPRRLNDRIPRDLETICLKAMSKEPARRYQAAHDFASDLGRWLKGEPIQARPVGKIEQAWRWARRRPAVAGLAAALILVILVGMTGLTALWLHAEEQRALAQRNADEASDNARREEEQRRRAETSFRRAREAVDKMLSHVGHERLRYVPQMERLRRELLQEALRFNEGFLQEGGSDVDVQRGAAWAYERMGHIHEMLGERDKAEQDYRRAIHSFDQLADDSARKPECLQSLVQAQSSLANLLDDLGRHAEAEKVYRDSQALSADLVARFPGEPIYRHGLSLAHYNLAMLRSRTGLPTKAEEDYRQAIDLQEKLAAETSTMVDYRRNLAMSLDGLGSLLDDVGRPHEAEVVFQRARGLQQKLMEECPTVSDIQWDLARTEYNLGVLYQRLNQLKEAEGPVRRSIALKERLVADFPSTPDYRRSCGTSHRTLALLLQRSGRLEESEKHYARAIALQEKLVADFPGMPAYRFQLAESHNNRSMLLLPLGRVEEAEQSVRKALGELEKLATVSPSTPEYESFLGGALHNLAKVLMAREQWTDARLRLEQAVRHQQAALASNPKHPMYREFLRNHHNALSSVLLRLGERPTAEKASREAIRLIEELVRDNPNVAAYRSDLGATIHNMVSQLLLQRGELVEARQLLETAIQHQSAALQSNPEDPTYRTFLRNHWWILCETMQRQGDHRAAAQAALQLPLLYPKDWVEHKRAAGLLAGCILLVEADASLPTEQRRELAQAHADQALTLLRTAIQNGFNDAEQLGKDKDLDPLRSKEEFQKLLRELTEGKAMKP